jgi:hypothetical protein
MHTVQIYSTDFTGIVDVQATLENGVTDVVTWAVVETVDITDPLIYHNFKGVYSWIRFHIKPDVSNTGTVDKILYRS